MEVYVLSAINQVFHALSRPWRGRRRRQGRRGRRGRRRGHRAGGGTPRRARAEHRARMPLPAAAAKRANACRPERCWSARHCRAAARSARCSPTLARWSSAKRCRARRSSSSAKAQDTFALFNAPVAITAISTFASFLLVGKQGANLANNAKSGLMRPDTFVGLTPVRRRSRGDVACEKVSSLCHACNARDRRSHEDFSGPFTTRQSFLGFYRHPGGHKIFAHPGHVRCARVFGGDGRNHLSCLFRSLHLFFKLTRVGGGAPLVPQPSVRWKRGPNWCSIGRSTVHPAHTEPSQYLIPTRAT